MMENNNPNEEESSVAWAPIAIVGAFVLGCSFLGSCVVEAGQTLLDARKAKKEG